MTPAPDPASQAPPAGRPRLTRAAVAAGLAAALLALPACARVAPPGPTTPTSRGTGAVSGDWAGVGLFADAVMAEDLATAQQYVVPGSPAARYLRFQSDLAAADPARGTPSPGTWAVNVDRHLGEVTLGVAGATPVVWTDWRFAPDGRILQWSTPVAGPLEDRLWTTEPSATTPAGTVRVVSAFANDTSLSVVLEVTSAAGTQTPDCAATYAPAPSPAAPPPAAPPPAAPSPAASSPAAPFPAASDADASSPAPSGPRAADGCFGTERIAVGSTGRVVLQFLDSGLGGTLAYTLRDAEGAPRPARLTVG